jgi:hypothetical protein
MLTREIARICKAMRTLSNEPMPLVYARYELSPLMPNRGSLSKVE